MQAEAQQITYATYPEYKYIDGFEFQLPIEMPEDIVNMIMKILQERDKSKIEPIEKVNFLKKELDEQHGKYWHVFCGKNFGAYTVHDKNHFVFFKYRTMSYLIYKTSY